MTNSPNWTIRQCIQHEIPAVLELWREAEATVSVTDSDGDLLRATEQASAFLLVAESEGRLVGTVMGTFDGWGATFTAWQCTQAIGDGASPELWWQRQKHG